MNIAQNFAHDALVIFIGHSDDAVMEAHAIRELQIELQRELDNLNVISQGRLPFKNVRMWEWNYDALPLVGGQQKVITPALARANVAVFVFKERVGIVTWEELEFARNRTNNPIPVMAFFPENPPENHRLKEKTVARNWADLQEKRDSLTSDWNESNSRSLRPMKPFTDIASLKQIVFEQAKNVLMHLCMEHISLLNDADSAIATAQPVNDGAKLELRCEGGFKQNPVGVGLISELRVGIHNSGKSVARHPAIEIKRNSLFNKNQYGLDGNGTFGLHQAPLNANQHHFFTGGQDIVIYPNQTLWVTKLNTGPTPENDFYFDKGRATITYSIYSDAFSVSGELTLDLENLLLQARHRTIDVLDPEYRCAIHRIMN